MVILGQCTTLTKTLREWIVACNQIPNQNFLREIEILCLCFYVSLQLYGDFALSSASQPTTTTLVNPFHTISEASGKWLRTIVYRKVRWDCGCERSPQVELPWVFYGVGMLLTLSHSLVTLSFKSSTDHLQFSTWREGSTVDYWSKNKKCIRQESNRISVVLRLKKNCSSSFVIKLQYSSKEIIIWKVEKLFTKPWHS